MPTLSVGASSFCSLFSRLCSSRSCRSDVGLSVSLSSVGGHFVVVVVVGHVCVAVISVLFEVRPSPFSDFVVQR